MKKIFLLFIFFIFIFISHIFAAEFLVQAKPHWKDAWKNNRVRSLTDRERNLYDARVQVGDIIVIKPNGWKWGREETLPNYYIIKAPNLTVSEAEHLTQSLRSGSVIRKKRKFQVPQSILNQADENGIILINVSSDIINNLIEKIE